MFGINYTSSYLGIHTANDFVLATKNKGYTIKKSDEYDDINNHIDFFVNTNNNKIRVDVKSHKRESRNGKFLVDATWIEFRNVHGNLGWLYGKADYIAFDRGIKFLLIKRNKLQEVCEKIVDFKRIVDNPKKAYNCVYTRKNRSDLISIVKFSDLTHKLTDSDYMYWNII